MPKFLERELRQQARKKGFTGKRADEYVYGTMNNVGAMHGSKETAKGAAMERKHEDKMKTPSHDMRRVEIEAHRDKNKNLTGHTVHAYHMPKPSKKSDSGAFYEENHESTPFNIGDHKAMLAHVGKILGGAGVGAKPAAAAPGAGEEENDEETED
jgi:hypothetical protein